MAGAEPFLLVLALWITPVLITTWMGSRKGRPGWVWGLLLGWIGILFLALNLPPKRSRPS